jgi:hypothetical protein
MRALNLWPVTLPLRKGLDKRPLLEEFRSKGFFIIDTCELPVDKLTTRQRKETIARDAFGLARRARPLNPEHIIVVKKTVYQPVRDALEHAGLGHRILNDKPLSFPSHGNQKEYRTTLRRLVRKRQGTAE